MVRHAAWEILDPDTGRVVATVSGVGQVESDDQLLKQWLDYHLSFPIMLSSPVAEEGAPSGTETEVSTVYPTMPEHTNAVMYEIAFQKLNYRYNWYVDGACCQLPRGI
jgi:hypothetical protein